jgi:hypothetical protein
MKRRSAVSRHVEEYLTNISEHRQRFWTAENLLLLPGFPNDENHSYKVPNAWYRGLSQNYPLIPKAYRESYRETDMILEVRRRAHLLTGMPAWEDHVSWYFILQHHGFPTRLIDWSENPLVALYFAVEKYDDYAKRRKANAFCPVVWLIHPNAFNWALRGASIIPGTGRDEAVSSHQNPSDRTYAIENIIAPWSRQHGPDRPLAITGGYVHFRMFYQKSKFTVHGSERKDLRVYFAETKLAELGFAKAFYIRKANARSILHELAELGISRSSLFPDLDGISTEMDEMYRT